MNISEVPIDSVIPYENNPRHNKNAVEKIAKSLQEYGWQQPIVVDKEMVVIVGHTRLLAAKSLGMKMVPVHVAELSEAKSKAYRIADNRVGEEALWDLDALSSELKELSDMGEGFDALGFSEEELNEILNEVDALSDAYTKKVKAPTYAPSETEAKIEELYDPSRFFELIKDIENAKLDEGVKKFLIFAAHRHNVFNYSKIADFYARAEPKIQRLMENSALVIIDFNKALELGYVRLTDEIKAQYVSDHVDA
tara:strand:- start:5690 stop:6445 length:756 start_codon:yes stop_codon:yes gene_type:complete